MNDRVFWFLLGALALGWVPVYFLVLAPQSGEASEKEDAVQRKVRHMEKYARLSAEAIPTEARVKLVEDARKEVELGLDDLTKFYEERDRAFERLLNDVPPTDPGRWKAAYLDAYSKLVEEYRAQTGLPTDQRVPFAMLNTNSDALIDFQKLWRIQETIVRTTLKYGGQVLRYNSRERERGSGAAPAKGPKDKELFARIGTEVEVLLPPARVNDFVGDLLVDPAVTFEMARLEVGKLKGSLKLAVVETREAEPDPAVAGSDEATEVEPLARVAFAVDALDWTGEAKAAP